jgi:hypothetical protein
MLGECPCEGIRAIDFVMFGYEVTVIDQSDEQNPIVYQTMDPTETREAIPDFLRPLAVEIACECYCKLLPECGADYIYRVTWLTEPTESALKKHNEATKTLVQSGYSVLKEGTDQFGCKFWLLGIDGADHSNLQVPALDEQPRS